MFNHVKRIGRPFMYSVDVYLSLKDKEYVALSAFPVIAVTTASKPKIRPYAVGSTVDLALAALAKSISYITDSKEVSVINVRHYRSFICVECSTITSFDKKQELVEHLLERHRISTDTRYIQPSTEHLRFP